MRIAKNALLPALMCFALSTANAQMSLRDAIYLYEQPLYSGGEMELVGENCDVFQLVLHMDSGYTHLQMNTDGALYEYPDTLMAGAKMFAYMLYNTTRNKSFKFRDHTTPVAGGKIGAGTVFGYCLSATPGARAYLKDSVNCKVRASDNSLSPLAGCVSVSKPSGATRVLNSANQVAVAQDVISLAAEPLDMPSLLTGAEVLDQKALYAFAWRQMGRLPNYVRDGKANSTLIGAEESQTVPCTAGGSLLIRVIDVDNNGLLSPGDSVSISGSNCREAEGLINGAIGFVFNSFSGDLETDDYNASMNMSFNDLNIEGTGFSVHLNGTLMATMASSSQTHVTETLLSASSLTSSGRFGGVTRNSSLTNYQMATRRVPVDCDHGVYDESVTGSGKLMSESTANQTVSFAIVTPFVQAVAGKAFACSIAAHTPARLDNNPRRGVLEITAADNSRQRVTAINDTTVKLELDDNGDQVYEHVQNVEWSTLH